MKRYQSLKLCFSLLDDRSEVLRKPLPCSTACASMCQGMVLRKTNSQINQVSKDEIQGLLRSPLASMDPRSAILSASSLTRLDSRESVRTDSQESLAIEVLQQSTAQKSIMAPHMQEQSAVPLALAHKEMLPKTEKPTCALPQQVVPDSRPKAKEVPDTTPPGEKDQTAVKKRNPESVLQDLKKKLEDKKLKEQKPEEQGAWEPLPTKEEEDTVPSRAGAWLDYEWKGIPNSKRQRWAAERGGWRKKRGGSSQSFFCAKFHKDHGQSHSWYFRNG